MSPNEKRNSALLQFGFGVVLIIALLILVLSGHEGSAVTQVLSNAFSVAIGVLFTNAARDYVSLRQSGGDNE